MQISSAPYVCGCCFNFYFPICCLFRHFTKQILCSENKKRRPNHSLNGKVTTQQLIIIVIEIFVIKLMDSYLTKTFDGYRGYNEHIFKIMCEQIMILLE